MTITPEQFMTQPPEPDEDLTADPGDLVQVPSDPLTSIASSLGRLVQMQVSKHTDERISELLQRECDDLRAELDTITTLVEEIESIVKPSTSKLANTVREAIGAWRSPAVPAEPEPANEPQHPYHDAPVEEWRAYARNLIEAELLAPEVDARAVETMNRSQIRSLLGISQPGTPVAPSEVHS